MTAGRDDNLVADLSAYLDGELPEVRAREIEQQLADSDECRALLAELRDVSETLGQLPRQRAPDELVAALRRQAERRHLFDDARRPRPGGVLRLFLRLSAAAAVIGGCVLVGWHVADRGQTRPVHVAPRDFGIAATPELARANQDAAPAQTQKATGAGPLAEQPAEAAVPLPTDAAFAHGTVAADDHGTAVAACEPEPMLPAAPAPASSAAPAPTIAARTPADRLPVVSAEVEIHVVPLDSSAHAAARRVLAGLGEAALSDEQDRMGVAAAGWERRTVVHRAVPADEVAAFVADLQARLPQQTTVTMRPGEHAGALPRGALPTASTTEPELAARALMAAEAERDQAEAPRRGARAGRGSAHRDIKAEVSAQTPPPPPRRSGAQDAFELTWRGWRTALQSAWQPPVRQVKLRIMLLDPPESPDTPTPPDHP